MTHLRSRTLRLLVAGALAVGVAGTASQAQALSPRSVELTTEADPVDPMPPVDECDAETELCPIPVDVDDDGTDGGGGSVPVPCPEIPGPDGADVPDPGCEPPCPDEGRVVGQADQIVEIDPDCLPCPVGPGEPVRTDPARSGGPRRTDPTHQDPCDPPAGGCEDLGEGVPRVRSGDDDVVELRVEGVEGVEGAGEPEGCEPDRPTFTG